MTRGFPTAPRFGSSRALQSPPSAAESACAAAVAALNEGKEGHALRIVENALRLHPRHARLWQVAGLTHRQSEDLAPAVSAFEQAARLAPADPLISHGLARVYLEAGLPAVAAFRAAKKLDPQSGDVRLGLAAAQLAESGAGDAIRELEELLVRSPGWLPGHDALCRLRWQSGERENFTQSLDWALAAYPRDLSLWHKLLIILSQAELHERSLEAIARGRALAGENVLFDANEAVARAELGQTAEADRLFAKLEHLGDPTIRMRQVRHLLRAGRPSEAAELALPMTRGEAAQLIWPYLSIAWRLLGDPRWDWLEGDERLVGVYDIADKIASIPQLADRLRKLHRTSSQPLEQSVRGGTQTDGPLFARIEPEIRGLRSAIKDAVEEHVRQLPPPRPGHPLLDGPRSPIRFAGSWSVRLSARGHHSNHVHPAGWLSSAFYLVLPGEGERGADAAGWLSLGEVSEMGLDLPPLRLIEPKPGRLVLFPSTMWHGTRPFDAGERLTVAFDVARPR